MLSHNITENGILKITAEGTVGLKDIADFLRTFENIGDLPDDVKLLYDMQRADLKIEIQDLKEIAALADQVTEKYKTVRTAFVVDEPLVTAYSYLFSSMDDKPNRQRRIFSTIESAEQWLTEII
jgi:hypothetical protein